MPKISELIKMAGGAGSEIKKVASVMETPKKSDTSVQLKEVVESVLESDLSTEQEKLASINMLDNIYNGVIEKVASHISDTDTAKATRMVKLGWAFGQGMKLAQENVPLDELAARAEQIAMNPEMSGAAQGGAAVPQPQMPQAEPAVAAEPAAEASAISQLADKLVDIAAEKGALEAQVASAQQAAPVTATEGGDPTGEISPEQEPITPGMVRAPLEATASVKQNTSDLPKEVADQISAQFSKSAEGDPTTVAQAVHDKVMGSKALSALVEAGDVDLAAQQIAEAISDDVESGGAEQLHAPKTDISAEGSEEKIENLLTEAGIEPTLDAAAEEGAGDEGLALEPNGEAIGAETNGHIDNQDGNPEDEAQLAELAELIASQSGEGDGGVPAEEEGALEPEAEGVPEPEAEETPELEAEEAPEPEGEEALEPEPEPEPEKEKEPKKPAEEAKPEKKKEGEESPAEDKKKKKEKEEGK